MLSLSLSLPWSRSTTQDAALPPRPPALGFAAQAPLSWASWGTGSFQVWTVAAGSYRWFVSSQPKGFAVERRGPEGRTSLLPAVSLRGAVARVAFDAWQTWQRAPACEQALFAQAARAAGVPPGFLLDGPVR
jgi:hypothetical protein